MEAVLWIIVLLSMLFVCWMGDRETRRIDALEKRVDALEKRMNARDAIEDDGR